MRTIALRYLAEINPPAPDFEALPNDADVLFLPLETVWSDSRADQSRRIPKGQSGGYTRFNAGDIVSPKVTPTFQAGRSMITCEAGVGTSELHVLRARPGVDPRWICYAVRSDNYLREGVTAFQGVAGLQRVPPEFVASFRVADVNQNEQRRIADFLDDRVARIDQIIAARQQQAALLIQAERARRQQAFTDLVTRFGITRLGRCITKLEQGWSPQADSQPAEADEWGVMRAGCVNGGEFREDDNKHLPEELSPRAEYEIRPGDLLMSRASGSLDLIGSIAVVPIDVRPRLLLPDKAYRLYPATGWDPRYLAEMVRAHRNRELIKLGTSGADGMANNLPSQTIRDLEIPLAPAHVQGQVCGVIDTERDKGLHLRRALEQQIAAMREYKQSLITAAVTGEFDVTTASTKIPE